MTEMNSPESGSEVDVDKHYRASVTNLAQALIEAISLSQATSNLPSGKGGKRFWASVLFARLCGVGSSLQRILPGSASNKNGGVWDSTSALSLCRNVFETDLALFYLCTDEMSDEDYSLRINLVYLHDCHERPRILERIGSTPDEVGEKFYAGEAARLRGEIAKNSIFCGLPERKQKTLLEGRTPYYLSQDELFQRKGEDAKALRGIWELLSSHVHSYPFSYHRVIENRDRGTGRENDMDKSYCGLAAQLSASMLLNASLSMKKLFPDVVYAPRCIINWETLVCSPIRDDKKFVFGMAAPETW